MSIRNLTFAVAGLILATTHASAAERSYASFSEYAMPRESEIALARSAALMTMSSFVCFLTADFPAARRLLMRAVGSHRQRGAMMSTAGTLPALAHAEICGRRLREGPGRNTGAGTGPGGRTGTGRRVPR